MDNRLKPRIESGNHKRSFVLRVNADYHAKLAKNAAQKDISLNARILLSCKIALEVERLASKVDESSMASVLEFYKQTKALLDDGS